MGLTEMKKLTKDEINQRRPVWTALSELWLDTEIQERDLERIARVMADSGLTIEELHDIYKLEVAPVVSTNALSVAGEWTGFNEDWLCSEIIKNLEQKQRPSRLWNWLPFTRRLMTYATEEHWDKLVTLFIKAKKEK